MANFLAFLKNSGTFEQVQLEQFYQDDIKDRLAYKFSLSCEFKSPSGGTSPTSGSAPEAPPGPAAPGGPAGPATEPSNKPGGTATPAKIARSALIVSKVGEVNEDGQDFQ